MFCFPRTTISSTIRLELSDIKHRTSNIKANNLWYRLHVFLYDMKYMDARQDCKDRAEMYAERLSGSPYYTNIEFKAIMRLRCGDEGETFGSVVNRVWEATVGRYGSVEEAYYNCGFAPYALEVILEGVLGVTAEELDKCDEFKGFLDKYGLELPAHERYNGPGIRIDIDLNAASYYAGHFVR
ncbi:hypothetical protein ABW19_dt0207128 [Dactylella cylindrospora]|nr:hypothetical protein ABW19_dt0207128 [Dactylella cylindrospora]